MSTRQAGNRLENLFCTAAEELGYATFCARGSRGPVDVICFDSHHRTELRVLTSLVVQVGTAGKPIASTLVALQQAPRPIGSLCIVARKIRAKNRRISWLYHTPAGKFTSLLDAINAKAE